MIPDLAVRGLGCTIGEDTLWLYGLVALNICNMSFVDCLQL